MCNLCHYFWMIFRIYHYSLYQTCKFVMIFNSCLRFYLQWKGDFCFLDRYPRLRICLGVSVLCLGSMCDSCMPWLQVIVMKRRYFKNIELSKTLVHRYKHIVFVVCCRAAYLHRFYIFGSNYTYSSAFEIVFVLLKKLLFCYWLLWRGG